MVSFFMTNLADYYLKSPFILIEYKFPVFIDSLNYSCSKHPLFLLFIVLLNYLS